MEQLAEPPVMIAVLPMLPIPRLRRFVREPAGDWTIADVVEATGIAPESCHCTLEGRVIPPEDWSRVKPEGGDSLIVKHRPAGVEVAFSIPLIGLELTGAAAVAAAVVSTVAVSYGLSVLSRSLFAPGENDVDAVPSGSRRTISGSRNDFTPYGTGPQVLGRHRMFPPLAARSYTVEENGKLFQYALFTAGYGKLAFSEFKIADQPLFRESTSVTYTGIMDSDADRFVGEQDNPVVQIEVRQGTDSDAAVTLFSTDVQEQSVAQRLRKGKGWFRQRTLERATRITVIVGCPQGLIWRTDSGRTKTRAVRLDVRYRAVGTDSWTDLTRIKMEAKTLNSVYASRSWSVSEGTYEVEVKRISEEGEAAGIVDRTDWMTMLVQRSGDPVTLTGLSLVAAKIKITDEFQGLVDQLNFVAQTVCDDWNGSTWVERATSNPASLYRLVLQGRANKRAVADARIDLDELATWHAECDTEGFEFNYITQGASTVRDLRQQIAAAGRASPAIQDGVFSVVRENDLSGAPVQHFTPRNVTSFYSVRRYVTPPEAFKVQWVDPDSGWLDTERIVPDDGFTETSATTFERLDLVGITDPDQAYKIGRYHLAQLRLRPEEYIIETDFEHLDARRGDWVKFAHDVILVGLTQGRVLSVTLDGSSDAISVTVDQECPMAPATSYAIRFRKSDGTTVYAPVDLDVGNQTSLTFTTPIDSLDPQPEAGDLFMFGEAGSEAIDLVVKEIEPLDELNARLTLMDAAPGVLTAQTGTIPAYSPQITIPPPNNPGSIASRRARRPRILSVSSTDVRDEEGRGPVIRRGLRLRLQPSALQVS